MARIVINTDDFWIIDRSQTPNDECPGGCDCRVGTDDADANECGCGHLCVMVQPVGGKGLMTAVTHYEVRWVMHRSPEDARPHKSIKFHSLDAAVREAERLKAKNDSFLPVDGFTPFLSDITVWEVTEVTTRQVAVPVGG